MNIKSMFTNDIERQINGVVQVNQDDDVSLEQELREYIITKELRLHFDLFFDTYSRTYNEPSNKIGVWISGFYGSGKSHFLKILSYILANKEVVGKKPVEYFENKVEDPMVYETIKKCIKNPTETILFEIAKETVGKKTDVSIVRTMAKMFYKHLGYYGEELKIVKLEKFIESKNKTEEFKETFKELTKGNWEDERVSFAFFEDEITQTLIEVLGMSENSANNWFNGNENDDISINDFIEDVKAYVADKDKNFRLLFMIDEVGQYINNDINLKLNLQAIVEKIGSACQGKVWVMVTSQEAIDTFTGHTDMDFSGILGRFNTKLNLTSSSADEVIKKRILDKNDSARDLLAINYEKDGAELKNLYSFKDAVEDIKGFDNELEYIDVYPFVPYQFKMIQKVFDAIRTHGIASKHQSSGERSLLDCYQQSVQRAKHNDETMLIPFYYFYDTISNALDTTIKRVIERCEDAARDKKGIEDIDISVLKLLYLIRYLDDIPSNIDNITILMIDNINTDKIKFKEELMASLNRLIRSNYVERNGDKYNFLTNEEQDIAKEIARIDINSYDIKKYISDTIFGEIYQNPKYKYGKYNFSFDKYIDNTIMGSSGGDIELSIVTDASELSNADNNVLKHESIGKAIILLSKDNPYYEEIEQSMKIKKYIKYKKDFDNSSSITDVINKYRSESRKLDSRIKDLIEKAIVDGRVFVNNENLVDITNSNAKDKIEIVLKNLVESVYTKLGMVNSHIETDKDIKTILSDTTEYKGYVEGSGINNEEALLELDRWLLDQHRAKMPFSILNTQEYFSKKPFGWRDIDISGMLAKFIAQNKIELRYSGNIIGKDSNKIIDFLTKKAEADSVIIIRCVPIDEVLISKVVKFLREYLGIRAIPEKEVDLLNFIDTKFTEKQIHYNNLLLEYSKGNYPDKELVEKAVELVKEILSQKSDKIALLSRIVEKQDDILDVAEDIEEVENFFNKPREIFDKTSKKLEFYTTKEKEFCSNNEEVLKAIEDIKEILSLKKPYKRIRELPNLTSDIDEAYDKVMDEKKVEVKNILIQCRGDIFTLVGENVKYISLVKKADEYFKEKEIEIAEAETLFDLDAMETRLLNYARTNCDRISDLMTNDNNEQEKLNNKNQEKIIPKKNVSIRRVELCSIKRLNSKEDIDNYIEEMRKKLYETLDGNDSVQVN